MIAEQNLQSDPLEMTDNVIISEEKKHKRILWLLNHTSLREFEVPLLISLGYEVFTPKIAPKLIHEWSGSVDFQSDKTLTIPKDDLLRLNQHDFYEYEMPADIVAIINKHFAAAFCIFHTNLFKQIISYFEGKILLRAFGLDGYRSYSSILADKKIFDRLHLLSNRFWFSQSYPNLDEIELGIIKARSITHPIGLAKSLSEHQNSWTGNVKKILFFCARISTNPEYYGTIYQTFKKNFHDLPHTIAGNQPTTININDPHVTGYQPREVILDWMRSHVAMFYHSQEPRHLHYHPVEAILFGMPLIYMRGGLLERFGGKNQPGACNTYEEARIKIIRILNGDQEFIQAVRHSQIKILEPFTFEKNREVWKKNFAQTVMQSKTLSLNKLVTICIFLPVPYKGGSFIAAKNLAKMLYLGSRELNEPVNIVFSCIADQYDIANDFSDLLKLGISIRETEWEVCSKQKIELMQIISDYYSVPVLTQTEYLLPTDAKSNFLDCDYWLVVSDRLTKPMAPFKDYGLVIYDYIQRYFPSVLTTDYNNEILFATARNAKFVLTTTPSTRDDAIQFAGVSTNKVHVMPLEFHPFSSEVKPQELKDPYIIWPSNAAIHKNHLNAVEALNIYYCDMEGQFNVIMTGVETHVFDINMHEEIVGDHIHKVRNRIKRYPQVIEHLKVKGYLTEKEYISLIAHAKFLWHPVSIDNGTYSVIEAAYLGIPSLSSDYPQMKYLDEKFKLNLQFFNSTNPYEMACALKKMEREYLLHQTFLPQKKDLEQFSYNKLAPEYWRIFRNLL